MIIDHLSIDDKRVINAVSDNIWLQFLSIRYTKDRFLMCRVAPLLQGASKVVRNGVVSANSKAVSVISLLTDIV